MPVQVEQSVPTVPGPSRAPDDPDTMDRSLQGAREALDRLRSYLRGQPPSPTPPMTPTPQVDMPFPEPDPRERAIQLHCAEGNYDLAIAAAWKEYRTEMLHFLSGALRDEDAAQEVFSAFSEELWKGLPGFRWESSFRTWGYCLLRAAY